MALFEYFPNYVWNLNVSIAIESGGQMGEIVDMCKPLLEAAAKGEDAGTLRFSQEWEKQADNLIGLAAEDEALGRGFSASRKLERASLYTFCAERMQGTGFEGREATFAKAQDSCRHSMTFGGVGIEWVEFPYGDTTHPAPYFRAPGEGKKPVVIYCNGLDSCKELLYWSRLHEALARRGISCLMVDQPGTGEALRLRGLPATPYSEKWATPALEWLLEQPDVDPDRIGMTGISLGGHFAPRAVANEPRFAAGAVWGANHNWAEVQQKRLRREGENPVPHYWNHVLWVFGAKDMADFHAKTADMTLNGQMEKIRVPFLVTHGEKDRQIGLEYAHQSYDQLVNSPNRQLKIFSAREGGVEHVGADNMSYGRDYIADWFADTLGGKTGV